MEKKALRIPVPKLRVRVLHLCADPEEQVLVEELLQPDSTGSFELRSAATLKDANKLLDKHVVDLVLVDRINMDGTISTVLSELHEKYPEVPVIVVGDEEDLNASEFLREGTQDFIDHSMLSRSLLLRAIRSSIERSRVEQALLRERFFFTTLIESIPDRIFFKDASGHFLRVNGNLARLFGCRNPEEATGKTDHNFFSKSQADEFFAEELEIMRSGRAVENKVQREVYPNGESSWVLLSRMPLADSKGKTIGTFGISRDVTELKEMEERLATERNLLRGLIDNVPDMIHAKDERGCYTLDNAAHRKFHQIQSEEDLVGKTVYDFFPKDLATKYDDDDREVLTGSGALVNKEEVVEDKSGRRHWFAITKVPIRDQQGKITGLVCISRDIHHQKLAEYNLKRANRELSTRKDELQRALDQARQANVDLQSTQMQLIEAEKMQSVGRLAAGIAHEVKNPLGVIRMGLDFLNSQSVGKEADFATVIQEMTAAVGRADGVIRELLDFSSSQKLQIVEMDLNAVIDRSLWLVAHQLRKGKVEIRREFDEALPRVALDTSKIEQVLLNIFINASHAMPDGGILTLRTYCREPEMLEGCAEEIVLEARDSGSGIPDDKLASLFEPFFTTKPKGTGNGLGLTVTKKIIEMHHGTIHICNHEQGGAMVTICLPARNETESIESDEQEKNTPS